MAGLAGIGNQVSDFWSCAVVLMLAGIAEYLRRIANILQKIVEKT